MKMHLAIAFDQNYLQPLYALLASVFQYNAGDMIYIHAIAPGIDDQTKQKIQSIIIRAGSDIRYYDLPGSRVQEFITLSTWTSAVYYRLYFPLLVAENISRILYLDVDMIVLNDLRELYSLPLEDHPVAAVYDNYVVVQPLIGITTPGEYFNSGMLLMNTSKWNQQRISEQAMDYLSQYPERIRYVDQCGLNAVLYKNWKKIDRKFNLLYSYIPQDTSARDRVEIIRDCIVLHFTLERPWNMLCKNRFRTLYRKYLQKSGLFNGAWITDFSIDKIPAWIYIRIIEFYHDNTRLKKTWRFIKKMIRI